MTFFFTAFFMFWVFWRPQEWLMPQLFGWPILDVVVGISMLTMLIELNEGQLRLEKRMPQVYLLLGLWLAAPISHIPHTYFAGMMQSITPVFKICFFTLLLIVTLDRPERLRIAAILFVAVGATMAVHALLQDTRGYGFAGVPPMYIPAIEDNPPYTRSLFFGIFSDPNDLAQFLITCIPLSFVIFRHRSIFSFLVACGLTWLYVEAMLTTHSRGGVVGLTAIVAVQLLMFFPRKSFLVWLMIGTGGALALCPFAGFALDASATERVVFWGMANTVFKANAPFGIGYGMFWQITAGSRAAHNAFVLCYTELGLFGYFFWFGLLVLAIVGGARARVALRNTKNPEARWLYRLTGQGIVALMGFCASAYFLSRTFIFPLFFLMAMLGVVPYIARRYLPATYPAMINIKKDVYRLLPLATIASVIYIYVSIVLLNKALYG